MARPRSSSQSAPPPSLTAPELGLIRSVVRAGRFATPVGFVVGVAVLASSVLALMSAGWGLVDGGRRAGDFLVLSAVWFAVGAGLVHQCRPPDRLRASTAFVGMFACWSAFVFVSTVTYLVVGTFERIDDALFESVAGFTTTATTVVPDPEQLGQAVLAWRAGTQWLGGLVALLFVVAVLPSIGVGGLDVTSAGQRYSGTSLRSHRTLTQLRDLTIWHVLLTGAGLGLFLMGGMGPFDAGTYAATTISSGGFANHAGSFGHFGSATVEWAGFGGMVLGGMNMALLFRMVRGRNVRGFLRSAELRAYLALIAVVGLVVTLQTAPDSGVSWMSLRHSYFNVASAISTTGHFVGGGWGGWGPGPQVLLLAVMGVGSMSGSTGGGFRLVRALALFGYLRRELVLQLHPRAVGVVRVGRRTVSEELVNRMIGYQAQYLIVAGIGAIVLAALGTELVTAMSGAVSAMANVGPALGDLVPGHGGVLQLPRPARAALMPLMLLGRLEIAPVLVAVSVGASRLRSLMVR